VTTSEYLLLYVFWFFLGPSNWLVLGIEPIVGEPTPELPRCVTFDKRKSWPLDLLSLVAPQNVGKTTYHQKLGEFLAVRPRKVFFVAFERNVTAILFIGKSKPMLRWQSNR
jgi:hypothetical protein